MLAVPLVTIAARELASRMPERRIGLAVIVAALVTAALATTLAVSSGTAAADDDYGYG